MAKRKRKNTVLIGIIFVTLLIAVIAISSQPALIYGGEGVIRFDNGMQGWVIDAYLSNLDTSPAKIIFSTSEMQKKSAQAGNEMIPKDSETITVELTKKDCVYDVDSLYSAYGNGYYKVSNPQLDFELKATALSTGSSKRFSLSKVQATEVVSAKRGGQITASVTGVELKQYCYIPDNARIMKLGSKYTLIDSDKLAALATKSYLCSIGSIPGIVLCFVTGIIDVDDAKAQGFYRDYKDLRFSLTELRGTPTNAIGSVHTIVTADKDYFDAEPVVVQAPVAKPQIIDTLCPTLTAGYESSMKVIVKNTGTRGDIEVEVDAADISFTPDVKSSNVNTGEQKTMYFVMKPANVKKDTRYTVEIRASSSAQLGESYTDTTTCTGTIKPIGIVPPKHVCGDNKCDDNENYQTCPKDCKVEQCDINKLERFDEDSGKCVCYEGLSRDENNICSTSTSNLALYIIAGFVVFIFVVILITRTGNNKSNTLL